jgi:hypothetical protein
MLPHFARLRELERRLGGVIEALVDTTLGAGQRRRMSHPQRIRLMLVMVMMPDRVDGLAAHVSFTLP